MNRGLTFDLVENWINKIGAGIVLTPAPDTNHYGD